ncbi:hypothetical protein [Thiocapsa rosea]|uniref:hypothetical protein n=1 Tax=Thiocapsa rosea TaxID=69360 RepID=UPI0011C49853|nr:hypothetical protein [Thiocapsa rosea]
MTKVLAGILLLGSGAASAASSVPLGFSVLPEQVHRWEEAVSLVVSQELAPIRTDIHLGHQPRARWFVALPLGPDIARLPPAPILTLNVANLDLVELAYLAPDGSLAPHRPRTGDTLPLGQRDLIGATLAFRLDPDLLVDHALMLRVATIGQLSLLPGLTDAASFELEQARSLLTGGMLAALAGLFALLMLFAWVETRDRRFLAFVMLSVPFGGDRAGDHRSTGLFPAEHPRLGDRPCLQRLGLSDQCRADFFVLPHRLAAAVPLETAAFLVRHWLAGTPARADRTDRSAPVGRLVQQQR